MNRETRNRRFTRRQFIHSTAGLALGAALIGGGLAGCGSDESDEIAATIEATVDGDLEYFGWAEFVDPDVIAGFEKEYGVKVNQSFFDSDEAMAQKVASGAPYDIVMTNSAYIGPLAEAGYLLSLNHDALTHWSELTTPFHDPFYDPGAKYSIPYAYSPVGVGWRADKVDSSLFTGSWNDLWDVAPQAEKKVFVLEIVGYALGASLARLGFDINSGDPDEVDQAAKELIKLKPMMAGFSTDVKGKLPSGEAWIMQAWPGDMLVIIREADDPSVYGYQNCTESSVMGSDLLSIPTAAKSPGTALLFVDWVMNPEHSAKNVGYTGYPNGTKSGDSAYEQLIGDYAFLGTSEDALSGENAWKLAPTGDRLALWNKAWREVQTS